MDIEGILTITMIFSIPSVIGCISNITLTLLAKRYNDPIGKLIIMIALTDLGFGISNIIQRYGTNLSIAGCYAFFCFQNVSFMASIVSTCCFSHSLLESIKHRSIVVVEVFMKKYFLFTGGISILFSLAATGLSDIQVADSQGFCWDFPYDRVFHISDFVFWDIPCCLVAGFCVYSYTTTISHIKKVGGGTHTELVLYPIILAVVLLPRVTLDLYLIFVEEPPYAWLVIAQIAWGSQGFLNALAYGLSVRILKSCKTRCLGRSASAAVSLHDEEYILRHSSTMDEVRRVDTLLVHFEDSEMPTRIL